MPSAWVAGSSSSTYTGLTTTWSPTRQRRTPDPVRTTTPDASEPMTWNGWSCRAAQRSWRPKCFRKVKVGMGSNIADQTVL